MVLSLHQNKCYRARVYATLVEIIINSIDSSIVSAVVEWRYSLHLDETDNNSIPRMEYLRVALKILPNSYFCTKTPNPVCRNIDIYSQRTW